MIRCFSGFFVGCACDGARENVEARGKRAVFSKARWASSSASAAPCSFHRACPS